MNQENHKLKSKTSRAAMDTALRTLLLKFDKCEEILNRWDIRKVFHKVGKLLPAIDQVQALVNEIFLKDLAILMNEKILYRLWKSTLYRYVVAGRQVVEKYPEDKPQVVATMDALIGKTMEYFSKLLNQIEEVCRISKDKYTGQAIFQRYDGNDGLMQESYLSSAKDCYAFTLTLMGDTTRYSYTNTGIYKKSMILYDRARGVAPEKGRSYRQMGIVMNMQLDWLSGAYFLTRSKLAKEPEDVREDLLDLYDEARKEYRKLSKDFWYMKAKVNEPFSSVYGRKMRWYFSAGHVEIPQVPADPEDKEAHFSTLTDQDTLHRFMLAYTNFVGKLYTRIDVDDINIIAEDALVYFEGMITRWKGSVFAASRITQIMAMNMYLVKLTKDKTKVIPTSAYLEVTVMNFVMEVFSVLCEKLASIIYLCDWKNPLFEALTMGVHVWLDWMSSHKNDWKHRRPRPAFSVRRVLATKFDNKNELNDDVWTEFAKLMTRLEVIVLRFAGVLFPEVSQEETKVYSICICPLPECVTLAGFPEFEGSTVLSTLYFTKDSASVRRAQIFTRLKNIHGLGTEIIKKGRMIEASKGIYNCNIYKSVARTVKVRDDKEVGGVDQQSYHFYSSVNNKPLTPQSLMPKKTRRVPFVSKPDCNNQRIILKPEIKKKSTVHANGEMILPMTKNMLKFETWLYHCSRNYAMEILVDPKNLVIDTNCFVRHMKWVEILLRIHFWPLYIPVSVVLELKGLSKGGLAAKDRRFATAEKFDILREKIARSFEAAEKCRYALSYIQEHLPYFRVVTSTGRVLDVKNIRAHLKDDFFDKSFSNDERIIDTCRYLEGDNLQARAKDCLRRVYRNTIIVTSDRNLRISARSYELPAVPVAPLVIWLNAAMMRKEDLMELCRIERKIFRQKMKEFIDYKRSQRDDRKLTRALVSGEIDQHSYNKIMFKKKFMPYSSSAKISNYRSSKK